MFLGRRFLIIFFICHCSFPVVQNNARDYTFGALFGTTWVTFWHHLGDFGRHLGTSWAPRGSQNRPFRHQVAPKKQRKKLSRKSATGFCARAAFWRHLGDFGRPLPDFGRHLGPSWAPRGSQNRPFWHQVAPNSQKMNPRMRHQQMYEILIEI